MRLHSIVAVLLAAGGASLLDVKSHVLNDLRFNSTLLKAIS